MIEWARTVDPADEPVTLQEAKSQCNVFFDDDDALIDSYRMAARAWVEEYLSRALFTQTWKAVLDDWFIEVWLPRAAPLQSVTVQYYAADGTLTTLSSSYYLTHTTGEPASITRAPNQVWPALQSDRKGRVIITYVAGWADLSAIPVAIKHAIQLLIEHFYRHRGAVNVGTSTETEFAVESLLAPHRVWSRPPVMACS